jgi:hypothetical protein
LEYRGFECWISSRDVQAGDNFAEAIVRAIRSAKVMIVIFTSNANASDEIKKEVVLANQNKLVVIPVRMEHIVPNEALTYEFSTRQWVDLLDPSDDRIEFLAS